MAKNERQSTNKVTRKAPAKRLKETGVAKTGDTIQDAPANATTAPKKINDPKKRAAPVAPLLQTEQATHTPNEMEVHHHPHINHGNKTWKQYLLEGLMIFIAVMMGFIAENIREAITNSGHVKELTMQLVQDLKTDTLLLNEIYNEETRISKANDALFTMLQKPLKNEDMERLQQLVVASHSMQPFHQSAGAIEAIKKELHLKQFSSSKIISYISEYEKHTELLRTVQDITLQYQRSFIDPFLLKHFTALSLDAAFNKKPVTGPVALNLTQADLDQLNVDMVLIKINTNELLADNRKVKADAVKLMQYVKEHYNLEDE